MDNAEVNVNDAIMTILETMDRTMTARLDAILERMVTNDVTNPRVRAALAEAQKEIFNPGKNRTVEVRKEGVLQYKYDYAELNTITNIIREPCAKNGIAVIQTPIRDVKGTWAILTTISHTSGEVLNFEYPMFIADGRAGMKPDQSFAASVTFCKRQALKGIFAIADDTEDKDETDGNPDATVTSKSPKKTAEPTKPKSEAPTSLDSTQVAAIKALALQRAEDGWTIERVKEFALAAFKVDSPSKLHPSKLDELMGAIKSMTAEKALLIACGGETP